MSLYWLTWVNQVVTVNPHQQLAATSMQLRLKHQDLSFGIFPCGRTSSQCDICSVDRFADPQKVFLGHYSYRVHPAEGTDTVGSCQSLQLKVWRVPGLLLSWWSWISPRQRLIERLLLLPDIWERGVISVGLVPPPFKSIMEATTQIESECSFLKKKITKKNKINNFLPFVN